MIFNIERKNLVVVTVVAMVTIDVFGFFNFHTDRLWFGLNTYDIILLMLSGWFWFLYIALPSFGNKIKSTPLKYIFYIYIFILIVIFTMPLRGAISVVDAARVGRDFLLLPIIFLIFERKDYYCHAKYYLNLFIFIALISSIQIAINTFNPDLVKSIFSVVPHDIGKRFLRL